MKMTALYSEHKNLKAKLVDFNGWEMPISYSGIIEEHLAVRNKAGIFDVSHMGIVDVTGPDSLNFIQRLTVNDAQSLRVFKSQYTMMLSPEGEILDDMILTRLDDCYRFVVNCGNFDKIYHWMMELSRLEKFKATVHYRSDLSILAIQGPQALAIVEQLSDREIWNPGFSVMPAKLDNIPVILSRTGYTGEDGFEIIVDNDQAVSVWRKCVELGASPIGLGARDTLRMEAGLPLYGNEISEGVTPYDIGYGWIVKLNKNPGAVGCDHLAQGTHRRKLFGLVLSDKVIPRKGCTVSDIGVVTSGTFSPCLNKSIALFLANRDISGLKQTHVLIRGKSYLAEVVKLPFVKKRT